MSNAATGRYVSIKNASSLYLRNNSATVYDLAGITVDPGLTVGLSVDRASANTGNTLTLNAPLTLLGAETLNVTSGNSYLAAISSGITLGGTFTVNPTANVSISGVIDDGAGTYGIVKTGTGLLTLSGANKYKGGTTVTAGRLLIGSQAAATNAGAVTVNGGIYDLGGLAGVTNGAVTMTSGTISNGTLTASSYTFSGGTSWATLAGAGALTQSGNITTLFGNNTYSGGTAVNGGILVIPTTAQLPGWNTPGGFSVANGAGLAVGNAVTDGNVVTMLENGTFAAGAGFGFDTTLANRSYASVFADTGAGALGLIKLGANTLTLSSGNTYSGGTAILGGTLSVPSDSALGGAGGGLMISNNAALQFSGDMTLNNRPVVVRSSGQIIGDAGKSLTLTNDLTVASGSLTVTGACSVALGGNNVFLNSTWLQGGNLTFLPTSSNLFNTAEFRVGHNPGSTGRVTQVGGYVAFNGNNNGLLLGNLGGEGTYTLDGGGTLRALPSQTSRGLMLGVNHFSTGTFYMVSGVLTGTVFQISRTDATGTNSAGYYYQSGGTAGFNTLYMAGNLAYSANNYALLSISNGTFYAAAFSGLAAGSNSIGKVNLGTGALATLPAFPTARGPNAYAELLFDGGTLSPAVASTTYMSGLSKAFITDLGATFNVPGGRNITVAQVLEDKPGATGDLTKAGTGVLTLTGANLYTGNTAINDGVLSIPNTGALPGWNVPGRYTVASGAALAFGNVYLDSDIATILATGNYLAGSSLGFDTTAGNRTYSSVLEDWPGGSMGLVKWGANTLTLDNANTYTGWTIVHGNNGTGLVLANPAGPAIQGGLQLGAVGDTAGNVYLKTLFPNQFGPNSVLFLNKETGVNSTPVFELLGNNQVVAGLSIAGTTYIENTQTETGVGSSILTVSNSVDNSYNSVIRNMSSGGIGTLGLTKDGPAALTLSGAGITYTGPTLVKNGTLILTNTTALGSAVTIQDGQLLLASSTAMNSKAVTNGVDGGLGFLATNVFTIGGLNGSGNFALTNDAGAGVALTINTSNPNNAYSGALSGSGSLVKLGIGDQALSGASTFSGGVVLGNETSNISTSSVATASSGGFVTVGHNQALGSGTLAMKGTQLRASIGGLVLPNDIDCSVIGGFRFGGSQDLEFSGNVVVDGVRGLGNYSLNRTLTLSGASISVTAGSALNFEGWDGAAANGTTVVTGSITGEGAVSVYSTYDNGTVTLSGLNTFSGGMTLSTGTLNIGHPSALGTGTFTIGAGKFNNTSGGAMTLAGNIPQTWNGDFTFIGTDDLDLGTGNVTLSAQRYVTVAGGTLTVGGVIDGISAFGLIKQGNGTMVLSGANTYGGTTYPRAGTLKLGADNTLPNNPVIFQNRTGWTMATIDLNGKLDTIGTLTLSEASSVANQVGAGAQTRIIDSEGGGLLALGGDVTYNAGPTGEEHGQASISANLDLGGAVRTFTINDSPTATVDTVISGVISGAGFGLVKAGAGVMQLEGVNTYSGDTTISAGTLNLSGTGSITPSANISVASGATLDVTGLSSAFVVDSAQTLKGFGTVVGNVAVAGGVQPGDAFTIGTLAMNGNVTFQAGSTATFDLGSLTGVGGNTNDLLDITGDLNAAGTIRINVTEPLNTSGSYCLIKYTGSRSGTFAVTVNGRYTATLNYATPGQVNVSFTTTATKALTWKGTAGYTAWDQGVSTNWNDGATMTEFFALDNVTFDGTADDNSVQLAGTLAPASLTVSGGSDITLSGSGSIDGPTGLAKSGAGTLTLGTVNNFTGATTVSGGNVRLGSATALGASSSLTLSGGAKLSGSDSVSARTLAMPYTLASDVTLGDATDSAALTLSGTNTLTGSRIITTPGATAVTMSGVVVESGGSFGITKAGSGTLTLNRINTFTGNSVVEAGTLDVVTSSTTSTLNSAVLTIKSGATAKISGTGSALGDTTDVAIEAGGFLDSTKNDTFGGLSGAGTVRNTSTTYTLQVNNGNETTEFSGTITNTGSPLSLQKNGTGTLTLSGVSTYAATTVIDGTLRKAAADALPSGTPLTLGATTTAGKLDLTTFSQTIGSLNVNSTSISVTNRIEIAAAQTLRVTGNVTVGVNVNSAKTVLASSGGGNLQVANPGGTFKLGVVTAGTDNRGQAFVDLSGLSSFSLDLGAGALTVAANGDNSAAYPCILTLASSNTLNAATVTVGASALGAFHEIRLGPVANRVFANTVNIGIGSRDYGRISFAGNNGAVTLRGLGGVGRANVTMGVSASSSTGYIATNVFDVAGHESDLLIGTLALGNYPVRVGAWRTYFAFDQGVLDVSNIVMSAGCKAGTSGLSTLNLGGGIANIGSLSLSSSTATGIVNVAGGAVTLGGDIVKQPSGRAMLTLSSGTLDMQSHSIGSASDKVDVVTFTGGRLMNLAGFNGGDPLVKTGIGTLEIAGANTYTGTNYVMAGTLFMNGTFVAESAVMVTNNATLGGIGTITGAVNVASAGTLSPGTNSVGTLTVGTLALSSNATYVVQLGGTGLADYDRCVVSTGAINIGNSILSVSVAEGYVPQVGDLFTIIRNVPGSAVTGRFTSGTMVKIDGVPGWAEVLYTGGSGQDVVLRYAGRWGTLISVF